MVEDDFSICFWLFHDGGRYHKETSPLIYSENQWTGFYMITASAMKELIDIGPSDLSIPSNLEKEDFYWKFYQGL